MWATLVSVSMNVCYYNPLDPRVMPLRMCTQVLCVIETFHMWKLKVWDKENAEFWQWKKELLQAQCQTVRNVAWGSEH